MSGEKAQDSLAGVLGIKLLLMNPYAVFVLVFRVGFLLDGMGLFTLYTLGHACSRTFLYRRVAPT